METSELRLVGQIYEIPRNQIRPFANQPRTYFDPDELAALAQSISAHGQLIAGEVRRLPEGERHKFELVDGQRRWHATGLAGLSVFRATIVEVGSEREQFLRSVGANFGRAEHTEIEIAEAIRKMRYEFEPPMTLREVADVFGKSDTWVNMYASLLNLEPTLKPYLSKEIARDKRLKLTVARKLAQLAPKEQLRLTREVLWNSQLTDADKEVQLSDAVAETQVALSTSGASAVSKDGAPLQGHRPIARGRGQIHHDKFRQILTLVRKTAETLEAQKQRRNLPDILRGRSPADLGDIKLFCQIARDALQDLEALAAAALGEKKGARS